MDASDWGRCPQNVLSLVAGCYLAYLAVDLGVAPPASVDLDCWKLPVVYSENLRHSYSSAPCSWSSPPLALLLGLAFWAFAQGMLETDCLEAWPWAAQGSRGSDRVPAVSVLPCGLAEDSAAVHFHVPGLGVTEALDLQVWFWDPADAVEATGAGAHCESAPGRMVVPEGVAFVLVLVPVLEAVEPAYHSQKRLGSHLVAEHGPIRHAGHNSRCPIAHSNLGHSHCHSTEDRTGCLGPDAAVGVAGVRGIAGVLPGVRAVRDIHHGRHSLGSPRSVHNSAGGCTYCGRGCPRCLGCTCCCPGCVCQCS